MELRIPDHEMISQVARGSYGVVWLARNVVGRFRAVKVVYRDGFTTPIPFEREFQGILKFEPISRTHEGLVNILHVGQKPEEGLFYYIMEAADDIRSGPNIDPASYMPCTLGKMIEQQRRLSTSECVRLGLALCRALAHLHEHGLLHRDIKPSNIIFIEGTPKLADIGLVTEISDAKSFVGTQGFIPPEGPGTAQADIYSLGKVLYEAATGRDRQRFPELPTQLCDPDDEEDFQELNEVITRACHNDPAKRYKSAREMERDLELLSGGRSLKRLRLLERRLAWFKRAAVIAVMAGAVIGGLVYQQVQTHKLQAEARQRQAGALAANGARQMESGNYLAALPLFVDVLRLNEADEAQARKERLRIGSLLACSPRLTLLTFSAAEVSHVEFSPDHKMLLSVRRLNGIDVFDAATGEKIPGPVEYVEPLFASFSPDSGKILIANWTGGVTCWSFRERKIIATLPHPAPLESARFSPDGTRVVTAAKDKIGRVWDFESQRLLLELRGHEANLSSAEFSPDGRLIVTASTDSTARLWDAYSGRPVGVPMRHKTWVTWASFDPEGARVVTSSHDRTARVWSVATGQPLTAPMTHRGSVSSARFSPDGAWVITAGLDGYLGLWDAATGLPAREHSLLKHSTKVEDAVFASDGRRVLTGCLDGSIRILDFAARGIPRVMCNRPVSGDGRYMLVEDPGGVSVRPINPAPERPEPAVSSHFEESGLNQNAHFAWTRSRSGDSTGAVLRVWNTRSGRPLSPSIPMAAAPGSVVLSDDGNRLAAVSDRLLEVFATKTGERILGPITNASDKTVLAFSRKGDRLLVGSDRTLNLWEISAGRRAFPQVVVNRPVVSASFSPDEDFAIIAWADGSYAECSARFLDCRTGKWRDPVFHHRDGVLHACLSPNKKMLLTSSEDFTAMLWDAATARPLAPPLLHNSSVRYGAFAGGGGWLMTAASEGSLRLWDSASGEAITPVLPHRIGLQRAHFLQDDLALLTIFGGGTNYVWRFPLESRPLPDLQKLAHLLSNEWPIEAVSGGAHIRAAWDFLRAKYPSDFLVPPEDAARWHEEQIQEARKLGQARREQFHERALRLLTPPEPGAGGGASAAARLTPAAAPAAKY